jgi:hypothetical protein
MDHPLSPLPQLPPVLPLTIDDHHSNRTSNWNVLGYRFPKNEVVFFCQVIILYAVIITSIVNLSLQRDNGQLWIALLSSSLGYLLPNPSIKRPDHN